MPKISIKFISENLKKEFLKLRTGDDSERKLHESVILSFTNIQNDLYSCIKIPKKLWPKKYKIYRITNLWKCDLPNGWRLVFTIEKDELTIVAIILEWFSHTEYTRRFQY